MSRITVVDDSTLTGVTTEGRPVMLASEQIEETRTLLAWRLWGTGLEGASSMLPHAWPHAHCSAFSGIPVAPCWADFHHHVHRPPRWIQDRGYGSHRCGLRGGRR